MWIWGDTVRSVTHTHRWAPERGARHHPKLLPQVRRRDHKQEVREGELGALGSCPWARSVQPSPVCGEQTRVRVAPRLPVTSEAPARRPVARNRGSPQRGLGLHSPPWSGGWEAAGSGVRPRPPAPQLQDPAPVGLPVPAYPRWKSRMNPGPHCSEVGPRGPVGRTMLTLRRHVPKPAGPCADHLGTGTALARWPDLHPSQWGPGPLEPHPALGSGVGFGLGSQQLPPATSRPQTAPPSPTN